MEIVLITSSKKGEEEPELIAKLFEAGLTTLHLRKPSFSTRQLTNYIEAIPAAFHNRIIVHSHHELVFKYDLKGVHFTNIHLGRKFQKWWFLRKLKARNKKIVFTRSYHKLSEVYDNEELDFNYFLLGTIFNNLTNEFYSGFYEQGISAAIKTAKKDFVARGGINEITIAKAYKLGFKGVALNSQIWKAENPFGRFLEILAACKKNEVIID
ncbi:MAG TPA: thiamine phosphate synthase [Bacteroidia bacterium]|jgi:thiamine-phosphate pyrophosphorylase|nr:thiamine phosphate synthase [Bacteroidia bacterium]